MDNLPEFTSTEEFEPFDGVIGQKEPPIFRVRTKYG